MLKVEKWQGCTSSQILKLSAEVLKKGLAWSDSDACYFSSSQTIKIQQNTQSATIVFTHQNIFKDHGLHFFIMQKINPAHTKRTKTQNIFNSKVTVQGKLAESSNDSLSRLCSHQLTYFATNKFRKIGVKLTITYYTQYIHGQYPSAPIRDWKLHYGLLSVWEETLTITESYQFNTFGNCINNCMHALSYRSVCIYMYTFM